MPRSRLVRIGLSSAFIAFAAQASHTAFSQGRVLPVTDQAWGGISSDEQQTIKRDFAVQVVPHKSYGVIIDRQNLAQSTPGSNAGTAAGSALAEAAYLDQALQKGDHSFKGQLAAAIIGGVIGSALNQQPQRRYVVRYSIKQPDGAVFYRDHVSSSPFMHTIGMCIDVESLELAPDQSLCNQTPDSIRAALLIAKPQIADQGGISATNSVPQAVADDRKNEVPAAIEDVRVMCKVGSTTPILTTAKKCSLVEGVIWND